MEQLEGLQWMGDKLTAETVLALVRSERARSVGLDMPDDGEELTKHRELALAYYKGEVPDMPVAMDEDGKPVDSGRSKAVSTDLADAVETILPDIMEVFFGGEDALTLLPRNEDDVEAADQETEYLREIIFRRNSGFKNVHDWVKESLLCRTGIAKYWWEDQADYEEYEGEIDAVGLQELQTTGVEMVAVEPIEGEEGEEPRFMYKARKMVTPPTVRWKPVPSSDFGVSPETVELKDSAYCVMRSREQRQDLIAAGYDAAKVRGLPDSNHLEDEDVNSERNTSGEDEDSHQSMGDLAIVETYEHYIRVNFGEEGAKPKIWRVITGNADKVLLDIAQRPRIEFAALCPFPMMFRFHGMDMADKLMEIQRINTALTRNGLDSNGFQLNQRPVIAMDDTVEETMDDIQENEPGSPIRVKRQGAIVPYQSAPLAESPWGVIEQVKTMGEQRSGVVRNAQGLNPDSLHETKGGMQIQNNAAQKRTRMIARLFAETGMTDLFLGIHDMLRSNATMSDTARIGGKFVPVSPNEWERRADMVIEVGVGSGGRDADIMALQMLGDRMASVIEAQGGMSGPLVTPKNVYALAEALGDRLGQKKTSLFFTNPESPEAQQAEQQKAQQPDPEMAAKQAEMQFEQQKAQMQAQMDQQAAERKFALEQQAAQQKAQLDWERAQIDAEIAAFKAEKEADLALRKADWEARNNANLTNNRPGGSLAK